jgi:hypothetical protein
VSSKRPEVRQHRWKAAARAATGKGRCVRASHEFRCLYRRFAAPRLTAVSLEGTRGGAYWSARKDASVSWPRYMADLLGVREP